MEVAQGAGDRRSVHRVVDREAAEDHRAELVQAQLEARDDAEVAAAAAVRPQQIRILVLAGEHLLAVGGDELDAGEVVAGEPVLAFDPAGAAAEREAGDARRRDPAARRREAVLLRAPVQLAPQHAGADADRAAASVDLDRVEQPDVDHHAVVDERHAGDAVPAGADGHRQPAVARVGERERDIVGARAPGDQRGPFVDHRVEDGPSLVVAAVVRGDLLAGEASNRFHSLPPVAVRPTLRPSRVPTQGVS